jgi:hypothetical protein
MGLDASGNVPRGRIMVDAKTLPAPTQAKLAQKIALRSELAALTTPGTSIG